MYVDETKEAEARFRAFQFRVSYGRASHAPATSKGRATHEFGARGRGRRCTYVYSSFAETRLLIFAMHRATSAGHGQEVGPFSLKARAAKEKDEEKPGGRERHRRST